MSNHSYPFLHRHGQSDVVVPASASRIGQSGTDDPLHFAARSLSHAFELSQVTDFCANVGHVLLRQNFDLRAVELVTASKAKKITRIVDGKAEIARASYEGQSLLMRCIVEAVSTLTARWRCK